MLRRSCCAAVLVCSVAFAAERPPLIQRPVPAAERLLVGTLPDNLDGRLAFAYRVARAEGHPAGGLHWLLGNSIDSNSVHVTVRTVSALGEELAGALQQAGCVSDRLESGLLASVGPIVSARCSWEGLWAISAMSQVVYVSPTFDYEIHRPLAPPFDATNREVEGEQLIFGLYPAGAGAGVTVADIDSGVDPFHPFFFRADGGAFAWIDVNQNGFFDPLVDAVDFNRNGVADPGEKLGILKAKMTWLDWYAGFTTVYNAETYFRAGYDWLYQDENGDGVRNFSAFAPYGDAKPTFGEQLYVADDVNRNGELDLNERVLRLNTPKIKALAAPGAGGTLVTYRRGINLSQYPEATPGSRDHGSMVLGTIAGGVNNVTRYQGIAPDVELLLATSRSMNLVNNLAWARNEGAQIVLWEMATWYSEFLDGSSNLEVACDAASDLGVLQIGAAGNLGGSQKHRVLNHPTGTQTVPLTIPPSVTSYVFGDFIWRQPASTLAFSVKINGVTVPMTGSSGSMAAGNVSVQWYATASTRGTQMVGFYIAAATGQLVSGQDAIFTVTNSGATVALHGYVTDSYTSWNKGVFWPTSTGATDFGTYGTPGVGDKTLAIATYYAALLPTGAPMGDLAFYSGRGPRIDGAETVDFASPEDHITAYVGAGVPQGSMWIGGGTSNASPVAVGVAALVKQANPTASSAELIARLRATAFVEPKMGTIPNDQWGRGKIRAFRAAFDGGSAPADGAPVASGTATPTGTSMMLLNSSVSFDPEGMPLLSRWDLDYDGTWDVPFSANAIQTVAAPANGSAWAKLEVVDPSGHLDQTLVQIGPQVVGVDGGTDAGIGVDAGTDAGLQPDGGTRPDGGAVGPDGGALLADGGVASSDGGAGITQVQSVPDPLGPLAVQRGCGCSESGLGVPTVALLALFLRRRRETF